MSLTLLTGANPFAERLKRIKEGDKREREMLIEEYMPFVIKAVSSKTNRYIERENSEEFMIGLEAFDEAIEKYNSDKGGFLNFAIMVINSRITDHYRKNRIRSNITLMSELSDVECCSLMEDTSVNDCIETMELQIELQELKRGLEGFGITFNELVEESPKHRDTRIQALHIAHYIYQNERLKEQLMRSKRLPNTDLVRELHVSRKLLNRSRKFIIATVVILNSQLEVIKNYIYCMEGGEPYDL
ncbi:MAG: sigI [Anaerocolumna sp.]|jgi:RNA polymerase sigma factor|nr:sigI [Anaerocolumna sp.]